MPNYEKDDGRVAKIAAAMLKKYHGELLDAEVRIDYLAAHAKADENGDPVGAALKVRGHSCAAVVRVLGLKDRAKGCGDAEIVVDGDRWDEWSVEEKAAIIDHELTHLELVVDGEGGLKRDDRGRPRLRVRLHDRQFGWFDCVARRHGPAAIEVVQAVAIADDLELRQLYFPGFEIAGPTDGEEKPQRAERSRAVSDDEQAEADRVMRRMGHKTSDRAGGGEKRTASASKSRRAAAQG